MNGSLYSVAKILAGCCLRCALDSQGSCIATCNLLQRRPFGRIPKRRRSSAVYIAIGTAQQFQLIRRNPQDRCAGGTSTVRDDGRQTEYQLSARPYLLPHVRFHHRLSPDFFERLYARPGTILLRRRCQYDLNTVQHFSVRLHEASAVAAYPVAN